MLSVIAIAVQLWQVSAEDGNTWSIIFFKADCIVVHGHSSEVMVQHSDVVKGLSEPQLFNDRLAGRFWHFLATVIREGGLVAVWGGDFEVASFACFEGHPLGLQPSSELAELHHLASLFG
ncbi:hypothetical protein EMIT0P291_110071 [Pseudomonas sp. IT-P291]